MQERQLSWYDHVMRREEDYVGRRVMGIEAEEEERKVIGIEVQKRKTEGELVDRGITVHR